MPEQIVHSPTFFDLLHSSFLSDNQKCGNVFLTNQVTSSSAFSSASPVPNSSSPSSFENRREAGRILATLIPGRIIEMHPLVLALPRGGVPVACELAKGLQLPLDIFLIRKFALPERPDRTVGAVASGGVHMLESRQFPESFNLDATLLREHAELARRESSYRQSRPAESIGGRSVIVVDDGLTTGNTMKTAIRALRLLKPAQVIAAIPVASTDICAELHSVADTVVCARTPAAFSSVRRCYADFAPILDDEIRELLAQAAVVTVPRAFHA